MSTMTRRGLLRGGVLASAMVGVPAGAAALRRGGLVVYDSAIPESRAFVRGVSGTRKLDLAAEHRRRFATLRAGLPGSKAIDGLTRWSDWVALRSELESGGWRLTYEARSGKRDDLFRWAMQRG
jgi:hypothetical protein